MRDTVMYCTVPDLVPHFGYYPVPGFAVSRRQTLTDARVLAVQSLTLAQYNDRGDDRRKLIVD